MQVPVVLPEFHSFPSPLSLKTAAQAARARPCTPSSSRKAARQGAVGGARVGLLCAESVLSSRRAILRAEGGAGGALTVVC